MFLLQQEILHSLYQWQICRVLNDYQTNDAEELTFETGDFILVLNEKSKRRNWMEGCLDADRTQRGLFSVHFVKFLDKKQDQSVHRPMYSAIYDNQSNDAEELSFKKGDLIIKLTNDYKKREQGRRVLWVYGCLDSDRTKRGLFPVHYVNFPLSAKCQAKNNHRGKYNLLELEFEKGDIILILNENPERETWMGDENWMEGCLNEDRFKMGYFPVSEVEYLEEGDLEAAPAGPAAPAAPAVGPRSTVYGPCAAEKLPRASSNIFFRMFRWGNK